MAPCRYNFNISSKKSPNSQNKIRFFIYCNLPEIILLPYLCFLLGLSEESDQQSVWLLQADNWQLEQNTQWTHGPVSKQHYEATVKHVSNIDLLNWKPFNNYNIIWAIQDLDPISPKHLRPRESTLYMIYVKSFFSIVWILPSAVSFIEEQCFAFCSFASPVTLQK